MVLLEDAAVLVVGGGADAAQVARREGGLEQVAGIERAARGRACTNEGVDLVDEQHGMWVGLELLEHGLEPLFEVAPVLRAGEQCAHVERIHRGGLEDLGHLLFGDAPGQAFGDGRLAHPGLAHQQGVVLAATAEHLHHALDLMLAANEGVDLAFEGQLVEVLGVLV